MKTTTTTTTTTILTAASGDGNNSLNGAVGVVVLQKKGKADTRTRTVYRINGI